MDVSDLYSTRAQAMKASEIRELLKLTENPDVISFAGGLPNPGSFPVEEVQEAAGRVLKDHSHRAMQYSTTEGVAELREELSTYLAGQGMDIHEDEILITNGSQQGLDLMGRVLLDPKDTIVVSNPTYLGALQAFNYFDARYAAADSDGDGIIPDSLDDVLTSLTKNGLRPKFMYTVPTSSRRARVAARSRSVVQTEAVRPRSLSFISASASSSLSTFMMGKIGPNDSSRITAMSWVTPTSKVGSKKRPLSSTLVALPPAKIWAPPLFAASTCPARNPGLLGWAIGPMSTSVLGSPSRIFAMTSRAPATTSSYREACT